MTGEDKEGKLVPQADQLSPFHRINLSTSTDHSAHVSRVDSPRAVVPKIKKSAPANNNISMTNDRPLPARRGRRAKNSCRKKTSETVAASHCVETENCADEAPVVADGKTRNGSDKLSSGECVFSHFPVQRHGTSYMLINALFQIYCQF